MGEVGTLKELGVGVGDVVEYFSGSPSHDYRLGERYACTIKDGELIVRSDRGGFNFVVDGSWLYRIISRAAPKLWRDMTPEEKGALLLAHLEKPGSVEFLNEDEWTVLDCLGWWDEFAYRIKPEPKVETVTVNYQKNGATVMPVSVGYTHHITFNLIDGKPDCASVKMEEL